MFVNLTGRFCDRAKSCFFRIPATILMFGLAAAISAPANAMTYDLGAGTSLGIISSPTSNVNDPAPGALVCIAANDTCLTKQDGQQGTYTGADDINSQFLWKNEDGGTKFSLTSTTSTSGSWSQIWQGIAGELLTHYVAVKASGKFHVIGYDLSLITAALVTGDIIKGSWTTGGILNKGGNIADMSHVSLYNSSPAVIPIPAALPLFVTGLLGVGFLSRRRRTQLKTA